MARSKEKNSQMRDLSRRKIREAALNQFSKKGLSAARMQDIACEAGISAGLMYQHFSSKDEIYADVIENSLDKLNEAVIYMHNLEISAQEKIQKSAEELIKTIEKSSDFRQTCKLITHAMHTEGLPEKIQAILNEKRSVPYKVFSKIMAEGQEENTVIDGNPEKLAVLFWSVINGLAIYYATRNDPAVLPDSQYILRMFFK